MKNVKYIIIFLIILLGILIGSVFLLNNNKDINEDNMVKNEEEIPQDNLIELPKYTTKETNDNVFFTISDIIQEKIQEGQYYIQEIYTLQNYTYSNFYTYGYVINNEEIEEYYLKVYVDESEGLFLIGNLSKEGYLKAKNGEIKEINVKDIQQKDDNTYRLKNFSSEEIARRYIKDYMFKVNNMDDKAYTLLEDEYRNIKFKTIENFRDYVQKNEDRFYNFVMSKYGCQIKDGFREYIVIDSKNMYYKITVYDTLDYKITLDSFSIETKEYIDEYNNSTNENKVATCISKVIKLINEKQYLQVYNYLDNSFKQNYFRTLDEFEIYVKNNFFNYNIVTVKSVEKKGEVYISKVIIKSGVGVSAEEKQISLVIKLLENTDFVMSFSVE